MGTQEDRQRILQMLAKGTISVEEADQLLTSIQANAGMGGARTDETGSHIFGSQESTTQGARSATSRTSAPKYLRVVVEPKGSSDSDRVNIRIPLQLLRAGAKLTALLPDQARNQINSKLEEKGMKFDIGKLTPETLESLMGELGELAVDVDGKDETVRIFCE